MKSFLTLISILSSQMIPDNCHLTRNVLISFINSRIVCRQNARGCRRRLCARGLRGGCGACAGREGAGAPGRRPAARAPRARADSVATRPPPTPRRPPRRPTATGGADARCPPPARCARRHTRPAFLFPHPTFTV